MRGGASSLLWPLSLGRPFLNAALLLARLLPGAASGGPADADMSAWPIPGLPPDSVPAPIDLLHAAPWWARNRCRSGPVCGLPVENPGLQGITSAELWTVCG